MNKGNLSDQANEIQINDNGVVLTGGPSALVTDGVTYENQSLPQDFSLKMPVLAQKTENTIDLGRCYLDFAPSAVSLDAHTRRLCGLQFTQVQLELRALFLDLALPDIRAYCHNKLESCDLTSQEFTITVSEPVMRRVQKLFSFYQYTGLEGYFQYNGYEIKNGAKIPFKIENYRESNIAPYEYRAEISTRVIGTYNGQAQTRENAGDVVIYWDKQRKNILMDFRTSVELFGFQINIRRTYDYSDRATGVKYTSSVNYWQADTTLVHGNAVAAEPCSNANETCTKIRHIATEIIGNDFDKNGLAGNEAWYDTTRFSEGVTTEKGGIIDTYLTVSGYSTKERLAFSGTDKTDYLFYATPGQNFTDQASYATALANNTFIKIFGSGNRLALNMNAKLQNVLGLHPRSLSWVAASDAAEVTQVRGFLINGSSQSFLLRWGSGQTWLGTFQYDGKQTYTPYAIAAESAHLLY